jgi:hypothetical protein
MLRQSAETVRSSAWLDVYMCLLLPPLNIDAKDEKPKQKGELAEPAKSSRIRGQMASTWQQEKHRNIVHYVGDTSNRHQHTKDARKKGGAKKENADQDAVESKKTVWLC